MARYFFFQAEDGIRDDLVTGVQTCALPISRASSTCTASRPRSRPDWKPNASAASAPPPTDASLRLASAHRSPAPDVGLALRPPPRPNARPAEPQSPSRVLPVACGRVRHDTPA